MKSRHRKSCMPVGPLYVYPLRESWRGMVAGVAEAVRVCEQEGRELVDES
jgi:hypothetical protein